MSYMLGVLVLSIFAENFVLSQFLGICPFLGVSKRLNTAVGMSVAVIFVMVLATAVTYPLFAYVLEPNNLGYLQTIAFILIIAALVQLVEIVLKKYIPSLYKALGIYLPLITTNCAVLGVTLLHFTKGYSYGIALVNAFGSGIGFLVAMVLFAGVRERLESCDIPKFLQGLPITLIAAAIVSLSFMGFSGIANGLIGG
ncbi:MAG: RnfABCDGE type electron transport complex subunit A [Clostridia bacterium]|nr:RnfABCDGE type electron transport complex subunit A [Clostridia bacterium]